MRAGLLDATLLPAVRRGWWRAALLLLPFLLVAVRAPRADPAARQGAGFDHGYAAWSQVLARHVGPDGLVDYQGLRSDPGLAAFLGRLASVTPEEVAGFSRDQEVAFYVNAFNAISLQTVQGLLPMESLRDVLPDVSESARHVVGGRRMSLHEIEHKKLRRDLREPMAIFVLSCGARGCPALADRAITADGLSTQLDRAAAAFLSNPTRNRIDRAAGRVHLSLLLDWYGSDFERIPGPEMGELPGLDDKERALVRLLARHAGEEDRQFLLRGSFSIVFGDFDWRPNAL